MLIIVGNLSSWFLTRFDTNQAILKALDTWYFRFKKKRYIYSAFYVLKTKVLISCTVTAQLICVFILA